MGLRNLKDAKEVSEIGTREAGGGNGGTSHNQDAADMARMGVKQETKRRFGLVTILGFTTTMMCSWESAGPFFLTAFLNGGPASMFWGYIFAFCGSLATCASMAEMASMYPISGGQYYWVSLLAPEKASKFLSFVTGWVSVMGWQASAATGLYLGGTIVQALVALNHPDYVPQQYQATLMLYAVLLISMFVNTFMVKWLPGLEGLIFILHVVGFFAILIPVVHLSPISSAEFVFTNWTNRSGYSSDGVSWFVGQAASAVLFIGYDGACHMAEEVQDAAKNVPRAMFFTIFINGAMCMAMFLVILFCFGDVETTLAAPSGYPFIEIYYNATKSKAGTTVMVSILVTMYICATFNFLASASRQAWAFARDGGLPFSHVFKRIEPRRAIPMWALGLTAMNCILLALINIGSSVAFNAVVSLTVASYLSSYGISIALMIYRRFYSPKDNPLVLGVWNLGRLGLPINCIALAYTTITVIFSFFPVSVPVDKDSMNWSCAVYGGVMIIGITYYLLHGYKKFNGPRFSERGF